MMLVVIPPTWFFTDYIVNDLKPEYRKSTEEPLVDIANILAASIGVNFIQDGSKNLTLLGAGLSEASSRKIQAKIYSHLKERIDMRVYVTDENGILLYDSFGVDLPGSDYSIWRDVQLTLEGKYGARTSREDSVNNSSSVLYVAAPILVENKIVGVLSVGKPSETVNLFVSKAERKIIFIGVAIALVTALLGLAVSYLITQPLATLKQYVIAIRDGKRPLAPRFSPPELNALCNAVESMRSELEGRKYIENYVLNLTHEIKSPIAAIQGAGELLKEDPPDEQKDRFISNILNESKRIAELVEKLLLLSRIEAQKYIKQQEKINLKLLLQDIKESLSPILEKKQLQLDINCETEINIQADKYLLRQAILNLLQNAIDFSLVGGKIESIVEKEGEKMRIAVIDNGSGIPD
jgi:two-component system sensor histidine kinase CreC